MEVRLDLALAGRLVGHLLDILRSDEGQLLLDNDAEQAERDLGRLFAAIVEAKTSR